MSHLVPRASAGVLTFSTRGVLGICKALVRLGLSRVTRLPKRRSAVRRARIWSNRELRRFAGYYHGDVINVSAWRDEDKEGGCYRDYFSSAASYTISNCEGSWRADSPPDYRSLALDLENPPPAELVGAFDVVFNHTTLEHVFRFTEAFRNLCLLSRDTIILVVPFIQRLHGPEDADFWRPTPYCLRRLCAENGFTVLYENANAHDEVVYLFLIASRQPGKWKGMIPACTTAPRLLGE